MFGMAPSGRSRDHTGVSSLTPWPVIWSRRALASSAQGVARRNARRAAAECRLRRIEREDQQDSLEHVFG